MKYLFSIGSLVLLMTALSTGSASAALVQSFEFNTDGDNEGFSGQLNVSGFSVAGGLLTGTAAGNDPQLSNPAGLSPTAGATWTTLEFRVRETILPEGGFVTAATFSPVGLVIGNAPGTIGTAAAFSAVDSGDNFLTVTVDISGFGSTPFNALRVDPIGGAFSNSGVETTANLFEVDFIRVYDSAVAVPEPSSFALLAIATIGGVIGYRRRRKA